MKSAAARGKFMPISFWIVFNAVILLLLFLDLAVANRTRHVMPFKQALFMSAFWIGLAVAFAVFVHQWMGATKALEFTTGYLLEEALSVDNLFVFILLFAYFKVPPEQEKTVLFWGIIGALIMRGIFIGAGVALVQRFHWVLYAFGVFLIWTGFKLLREGARAVPFPKCRLEVLSAFPATHGILYEEKKVFCAARGENPGHAVVCGPSGSGDHRHSLCHRFNSRHPGHYPRPFIVYTSNVFAILGLRSLYFALAGLMKLFHYLNYGLAVVLMFIGERCSCRNGTTFLRGRHWWWLRACLPCQFWRPSPFQKKLKLIQMKVS